MNPKKQLLIWLPEVSHRTSRANVSQPLLERLKEVQERKENDKNIENTRSNVRPPYSSTWRFSAVSLAWAARSWQMSQNVSFHALRTELLQNKIAQTQTCA